ncbi:serine/threonine-protein kinase pim-1-like [Engraulis encrasicolus]|uniref:serine/threonine-protein kinase pim-1-like n=1 Tax=Engraulis encrasicolus TaxID=184585 RepID=UPI002FCE8A60
MQGPLEVALMTLVSQPEQCPNIVQLLDWFDFENLYVLVLERPSPCADLYEFMEVFGGPFEEMDAKSIIQQLVHALIRCRDKGVFHRDLKTKNVLINIADYSIKLIDFGCGDLMRDTYTRFAGTPTYIPPEWLLHKCYRASPTTTWTLGILLFELVCGFTPFRTPFEITHNQPKFVEGLSEACKDLISWCLRKEAEERPTLEGILTHEWMATNLS